MGGQIVDASLVAAPKQRNTEDEKKAIKEGRIRKAKPTVLQALVDAPVDHREAMKLI